MKKELVSALPSKALSLTEFVTYAVYLLGGASHPVETEDVAMKAHEIAPLRFAWKKYPEQVNLELVRVYLSDAKKQTKGGLLAGSGREGWTLTRGGAHWASRLAALSPRGPTLPTGQSRVTTPTTERAKREAERLVGTRAWAAWSQGSAVEKADANDLFRVDAYADERTAALKVSRLRAILREYPEFDEFLSVASSLVEKG